MLRFNFLILSLVVLIHFSSAQSDSVQVITMDEAVVQALKENHDILVAENEATIEKNKMTPGNAGLFPSITLEGNYTENLNDTYIEFASNEQPPIDRSGARSTTYGGSVNLNYNLFGGLEKYYRLESLQNLGKTGDAQSRLTVENTIIQVLNTYLQAARLSEQMEISLEAVALSRERLQRIQAQYEFGAVTKLEVLNAKVDLNSDSIEMAQTATDLNNTKRTLMVLIGQMPEADYVVQSQFNLDRSIALQEILPAAMEQNVNLILAEMRQQNSELNTMISRAGNYPDLNLSASYGYNKTENEASFFTFQEQLGFSGSVNFSYPIFNGGQQNIRVQNAEIALENSQERVEQAKLQIRKDVLNAYANYQNSLFLLNLANDDIQTAQLNFERSQEAYQTGQINGTEFRTAQLNLIQAQNRMANLKIQAKGSEVNLYQLAGILIHEK